MRLLGINIPDEKKVEIALTYIYGVGPAIAGHIIKDAKLDPKKKAKDLTSDELGRIQAVIEKSYHVEGDLRQLIRSNITRLKDLKAYRGNRHARHLPVRGQRTKTNSRTVRGNVRKTAGSGKRKVELK